MKINSIKNVVLYLLMLSAGASACLTCLPLSVANAESLQNDDPAAAIAEKYSITVSGTSPVDISQLKPIIENAINEFESKVLPLQSAIKISIGGPNCLRVGYNFNTGVVNFCESRNVIQFGLNSKDVIRHEIFHAMVCNVRPEICSSSVLSSNFIVASHEALADFFAYSLDPKECFGDNFYVNQQCVRSYITQLCYSLVDGPHEKGNALETQLISAGLF